MVNQALVDRFWPSQDAVGKRLKIANTWITVVGVARNSKYHHINETPEPMIYLPLFQDFYHDPTVHVRVSGDPLALASKVEKTIHELNSDLPVFDVMPLTYGVQSATTLEMVAGTYVGAFGLLSLILAAVGIYGVVAYITRQRTHEIGIRMALGAQRRDVFRMVLGQGFRLTAIGLAVGLTLSFSLTRFLRSQLFGVMTTDALTYASGAILLCFVALCSSYIPALRATKVDPMVALRCE